MPELNEIYYIYNGNTGSYLKVALIIDDTYLYEFNSFEGR